MKIILLSGGSGKRLWPLSNDVRSKQFLKLLKNPNGELESMVQRITRQIRESGIDAGITIATSFTQYDSIINQLGESVDIVTEPERRDTFPAIALSTSYLIKEKECNLEEVVVVMPSDSYVDNSYFQSIAKMAKAVESDKFDMVLMGITPSEPSTKFGYIVPNPDNAQGEAITVNRFTEKPNEEVAKELISQGAVWNGGVFAFKLKYINQIIDKYIIADSFSEVRSRYSEFKKISFDYEVVEKANSIGLISYSGQWSDLGTWNSLTEKIGDKVIGNVILDKKSSNTHIINELDLPIVCLGVDDMIIATSPDGILVSSKEASLDLKSYADTLTGKPMYEERRWGSYRVMGQEYLDNEYSVITKSITINAGCSIEYSAISKAERNLTFIDGDGVLIIDGKETDITRGDIAHIRSGQTHTIMAKSMLKIIEIKQEMGIDSPLF